MGFSVRWVPIIYLELIFEGIPAPEFKATVHVDIYICMYVWLHVCVSEGYMYKRRCKLPFPEFFIMTKPNRKMNK